MRLDKYMQPGWEDVLDHVHATDMKYGMVELNVPAIVQPETNKVAAAPAPTSCGEHMQTSAVIPGQLQMPQGTSRP